MDKDTFHGKFPFGRIISLNYDLCLAADATLAMERLPLSYEMHLEKFPDLKELVVTWMFAGMDWWMDEYQVNYPEPMGPFSAGAWVDRDDAERCYDACKHFRRHGIEGDT
ncbi:hypothetical protein QU859_26570, partial [Escherichia coli]|nr:hypothetical protein [Escherichia coli]